RESEWLPEKRRIAAEAVLHIDDVGTIFIDEGYLPQSSIATTSQNAAPSPRWITVSARASGASSRGSRWPPATWPDEADCRTRLPMSFVSHLRTWLLQRSAVLPALRRSHTSKRTRLWPSSS